VDDLTPQAEQDRLPQLDEKPRGAFFRRQPSLPRATRPVEPPGERSPFDLDEAPPAVLQPSGSLPSDPVFPSLGAPAEDGEALARRYVRELFLARSAAASPDSDPGIRRMEASVVDYIGRQFDARQRRYVDEIEALEAKVARLRALVDKRQENRDDIVRKRLNQLLSESEGLGW
jgi:hypothetical protein